MTVAPDPTSLPGRLWLYQAERFPLGRTCLLTVAFSASSVTASAVLGDRALPGPSTYATAFVLVLALMFLLRALDEFKDAETDRLHRPERAVPRGLVSLRLVAVLGAIALLAAAVAASLLDPWLLAYLALVVAFVGLMTAHFFVPDLMRRSLGLTLVSHMLVMPLIDLLVTACEWLPRSGSPPHGLWVFLALSFANGCVLEIGRKTWSSVAERPGVESYSSAWGIPSAVRAWTSFLALAVILLASLGVVMGTAWVAVAAPVALFGAYRAERFLATPDAGTQKWLDTSAGLWVLASYATAGMVPALARLSW